ncbi:alanyl-tRNA editing protein [Burkholderia gladioli]|uniref:alanyl-tRNA editing protein n=2 Tax=Burkholderia gladioli TaxID=28095 RepID=UPI00163E27C9|nr:alanyl-tRNA editing protein [Burkholderia gladioli]
MTIRRYFDSDALTLSTEVLACEPDEEAGRFRVTLAETLFHPQGGGQPSDTGRIGEARVLRVAADGEAVVHLVDRAVAPGEVEIEVDAGPRALHARLHSAGHLIAYVGATVGWRAVKGHHWPGEARVVFERDSADAELAAIETQALANGVNAMIAAGLPRVLAEREGRRVIAYGEHDFSPCGGTHVAGTGEIGAVLITKVKEKKGQVSVQYEVA